MQLATGVVSLSLGITAPAMGADVPSAIEQRAEVSGGGDAVHGSPPKALQLRSDVQRYDAKLNLFIAEGNVEARLNGGTLRADRLAAYREECRAVGAPGASEAPASQD